MATAALDCVGYLPAPVRAANRGGADLLEGQLFACGCQSSILVVEVRSGSHAVHKGEGASLLPAFL